MKLCYLDGKTIERYTLLVLMFQCYLEMLLGGTPKYLINAVLKLLA